MTADLSGVLGALKGEQSAEQKTKIEEATKGANDLTTMVRKKPAPNTAAPAQSNSHAKAKRKAEDDGEDVGKKARVD